MMGLEFPALTYPPCSMQHNNNNNNNNGCLRTSSNVARLYIPRKEVGGGLIGIVECVKRKSKSLYRYLKDSTEWMLQMALKEKVLVEEENLQDYQKRSQELEGKSPTWRVCSTLLRKLQMWLKRSHRDGSGMVF